ncbi:hypothetical protein ES703_39794 [subsurface metagenome]
MSTKKSPVKKLKAQAPKSEAPQPEAPATPAPTLENLFEELQSLKQLAGEHTNLIAQLQETLARKRKPPASNGKVQILDKQTGKTYPSKNNAYQTLLKSGELKDLVADGFDGELQGYTNACTLILLKPNTSLDAAVEALETTIRDFRLRDKMSLQAQTEIDEK